MNTSAASLLYLYGIVPGDVPDPPPDLTGVEDGEVRVLRVQRVGALVSEVPLDGYGDEVLNARLQDLGWVGERGLEHERVLDWYAERGPVIPLSLFSLHADAGRVEARIRADEDDYAETLERLRGRREWGVKVWRRRAEADAAIDRLSPSLQALARQIADAPPGKRYLLEKRQKEMRAEEGRAVGHRIAHESFAAIGQASERARAIPIPPNAPRGERVLVLQAACLVPDSDFPAFQGRLRQLVGELTDAGFDLELTGPWPAYHFVGADDD